MRATRILPLLALALSLAACQGALPLLSPVRDDAPQWPEAPFKARVAFVKSVSTPQDAGIEKRLFERALDLITGAQESFIVKPHGVLFDQGQRLFVADSGLGVVHLMDTRENRYLRITPASGGRFLTPIALAMDEAGGLFISDSTANTVYRYDLATGQAVPFLREIDRPTGLAYSAVNKLLYVSETGAGRILAVDGTGAQKFTIDTNRAGEQLFNRPVDLAVDAKGQLFVNDPLHYKIMTFAPDGTLLSHFGEMGDSQGELNKPKGVAVDSEGNVYVSDSLLDAVQVFDSGGHFQFSVGGTGTDDGSFWMPSGIHISQGYLFVSDTYNQRVQVFRYLRQQGGDADAEPELPAGGGR